MGFNDETEIAFEKYYNIISKKYGYFGDPALEELDDQQDTSALEKYPDPNSNPIDKNHQVKFINFLKFIIDIHSRNNFSYKTNTHWSPITRICIPCEINYNYVIRTESLTKESADFFDMNTDHFLLRAQGENRTT